jgi:succinoglycan biosynthesis protein ExoA
MTSSDQYPPVSIIMPILNEADYIERSLSAMLNQDYPGQIEVLCIDGMSDDGTRDIVLQMANDDARIRLIDNPKRIIPAAVNLGFREASFDLVARMDGYLSRCIVALEKSAANCVGGQWIYVGDTFITRAIGAAMDSQFGVGTAMWRGGSQPGEVDTVPYGMWRRSKVLELGGFNENVQINEDYEFAYRFRSAGNIIYYSPDISTEYHPRQSLSALWRQYHKYGLWKARVLKLHPDSFRLRHGIAPLFVAGLVIGAILSPLWWGFRWIYGRAVLLYLLLSLIFAAQQAARHGWQYFPLIPLIFAILHLSWGIGFFVGVWRWWLWRQDERES